MRTIFKRKRQVDAVKENSLAVLADGYLSPMLLNTLMRQKIPALAQNERLENELKRFCPSLVLLDRQEAADRLSKANSLVYASSDEVLPIILESSRNPSRIKNISTFLDKAKFEQLLEGMVADQLCKEAPGESYACDAYFSSRSKPVVLGIYRRPGQSRGDQGGIVYYTNASMMGEMLPKLQNLLRDLSSQLKIKNFPVHMDFRATDDCLMPTKISPMRFGAFGLSDLLLFAYDINCYSEYFQKQEPDWQEILSRSGDGSEEDTYFWVMSRLPSAPSSPSSHSPLSSSLSPSSALPSPELPSSPPSLSPSSVLPSSSELPSSPSGDWASSGLKPDHEDYADTFQSLLGYCKLDLKRYPAFSIAYAMTKNIDEVMKYLDFRFESCMKPEEDESKAEEDES